MFKKKKATTLNKEIDRHSESKFWDSFKETMGELFAKLLFTSLLIFIIVVFDYKYNFFNANIDFKIFEAILELIKTLK